MNIRDVYIYIYSKIPLQGRTRRRSTILSPITHIDFCVKFEREV